MRIVGDLQLGLRAQPAAVAVRAGRDRPAGPRRRRPTRWTSLSVDRGDARRPPPGAVRAAEQGQGRGRRRDEGRGVEYEERMALLEDVTWPSRSTSCWRPRWTPTGSGAPWVEDARLSPKSVARDMFERSMTFVEYVALLPARPLRGRWCCATSPTPTARCARPCPTRPRPRSSPTSRSGWASWCARSTRRCSTSGRRSPRASAAATPLPRRSTTGPGAVTRNVRAFRVLVRNALFRRVELAALRRWDLLAELDGEAGWDAEAGARRWSRTSPSTATIGTGPAARGPALVTIDRGAGALARPAGPRRPGGRPRLGHHRRGRPRRVRRGGRCGRLGHRRRPHWAESPLDRSSATDR